MKKLIIFLLGLSILLVTSCKRDSDVLATYKGGEITRGEFHEWVEGRRLKLDTVLKKKTQQKSKLRQQVLDLLTAEEAKKAGYDKTEDYQFLIKLVRRNFIQNY